MTTKKRTVSTRARQGRIDQTKRRLAQRMQPLFEYNGWTITRWDELNLDLRHEDDSPRTHRYYSNLESALRGLAKQVGFYAGSLKEAIDSIDRLNQTIERAGV